MADRQTDHPSQKGWGATFRRRLTGEAGAVPFMQDFKQAIAEGNRTYSLPLALDPDAVMVRVVVFGLVAGGVGALGTYGVTTLTDQWPQAVSIQNDAAAPYGYQAIRLDNGAEWVLVRENNEYSLFFRNGDRLTMVTTARALEAMRDVTGKLGKVIDALEHGRIPAGDIPEMMSYEGMSEAYVGSWDAIQRTFESAVPDAAAEGRNLLEKLRAVEAYWQSASSAIIAGEYGYDAQERAGLKHEEETGDIVQQGAIISAALFGFLGATLPFSLGAVGAIARRRRRSQKP